MNPTTDPRMAFLLAGHTEGFEGLVVVAPSGAEPVAFQIDDIPGDTPEDRENRERMARILVKAFRTGPGEP